MKIIYNIIHYMRKHKHKLKSIFMCLLILVTVCTTIGFFKYKSLYKDQFETSHSILISNEALKNQLQLLQDDISKLEATLYERDNQLEDIANKVEELKNKNKTLLKNYANNISYPDKTYIQSTYIWVYLTDTVGLSKYVTAGILGNIMVEVGGQSLDISRYSCEYSSNKEYYGICQWSKHRKDRLFKDFGYSLEAQLKFLSVEIFEEIPESTGFYELTDEKEVALYFAKNYERCNTRSYKLRQQCATKALEYFTNNSNLLF